LGDLKVMKKLGGTEQTEAAVDKALAFLAGIQSEDGRWDLSEHGGAGNHDMAATGMALLTFYGRGERHDINCTYRETVRKGINWLIEQQDKGSGDLRGAKPRGDMYDHGIAGLAMVEAYGVTKDRKLLPRAQSAVDFIEASQNKTTGGWRYKAKGDGGFENQKGDLSVSGWIIMVLASAQMSGLEVKAETLDDARRFLEEMSGGKHGGSFGYAYGEKPGPNGKSPAMNAVGFFCRQLLGLSNNSELAMEASSIIDKKGLNVADLYYAYYGTLASYQQQGPAWRRWLESMKEKFISAQAEDGSWVATGPHGGQMGTVVATALAALSLEAHYRYTPLYGLGFEPDPAGPVSEADGLMPGDKLPPTPLFRHAQHIKILASDADDLDPVITDHGDFLYFASSRTNGVGGIDLYRSRFKRPQGDEVGKRLIPEAPKNLGPEINSKADETAPALRMAGFHLMFNSSRGDNPAALYGAMSRRVERRYDYSKMPTGAWMADNIGWILGLAAALMILIGSAWFAIRKPRPRVTIDEAESSA
ncbi:MAG: terpene cyclase/mutase family protein, partial [Pedosphaera sp.]|nr:terpene cyclase/mutase family protein [Pedosphaera sp.]